MSEKNYPPRAWLRPDHLLEMRSHDAVEFLPLSEHNAALAAKDAEIARLRERLEIDHAYDLDGNRAEVDPNTTPDGIFCRDVTIKMLEGDLEDAQAELAEAKARLEVAREALDWYAGKHKHAQWERAMFVTFDKFGCLDEYASGPFMALKALARIAKDAGAGEAGE